MAEKIQTQNVTCPNCGGSMKWNIKNQRFECESCRTPGTIDAEGKKIIQHPIGDFAVLSAQSPAFPGEQYAECKNCGAKITFNGNTTATVCPMCGSPQINAARQENGVTPDGVIPFKVDKPDAQQAFKKWVTSRWFAPNALKKCYQEGKLDGCYLPYFTYDSDSEAWYFGRGGKTRTRRDKDGNEEIYTEWHDVSGHVAQSFNDLEVCDANATAKSVAKGAEPYSTESAAVPYMPVYLSGMQAEHYATGADHCFEEAKQSIESSLRSQAHSDILMKGFDQADVRQLDATHHNVEYKHLLLPAWLSAFGYKNKTYTYMINGETGKVSGKRPYSAPKIIAAILVVVAIIAAIFLIKNNSSKNNKKAMKEAGMLEWQAAQSAVVMDVQEDDVLAVQYDGGLPAWDVAA